jgi:hypothetical protein
VRAATAIVGALAFSSILIALAFLLSDGGSSTVRTPTVTTSRSEPVRKKEVAPAAEQSPAPASQRLTPCGSTELSVEGVSCEVGAAVQRAYAEGTQGEIVVEAGGETVGVTCHGTAPIICDGAGGIAIYLPGD